MQWTQQGSDLSVTWIAPTGINKNFWYKVIIFCQFGSSFSNGSTVVSKEFKYNASSGLLKNVPLIAGDSYSFNVALFFSEGYAYSQYQDILWTQETRALSPSNK